MSILECNELSKKYGSVAALQDVNLTLEPGHIVGLLGPNGSGKTTLIKLCNGLITPSRGIVTIGGMKPGPQTKAITAYLPERNALPQWMNTAEIIEYYSDFFSDFRTDVALKLVDDLGLKQEQRIKTMSKGTKEKLQLILTMSRSARLYMLDEPIGGVDPATRDYILHTIISNYSEDATVLISTHLIADVEQVLDQVVFLSRGQAILHQDVDSLRNERGKSIDEIFREVFRC